MCHKINYYGMINIIPNEFTVCNLMWAEFTNQHKVSDRGLTTKVCVWGKNNDSRINSVYILKGLMKKIDRLCLFSIFPALGLFSYMTCIGWIVCRFCHPKMNKEIIISIRL